MKKASQTIAKWIEQRGNFRVYTLLLLCVMAIAYKYQVWRLGIYYDDWEGIFLYKQGFSAKHIWDYFLIDRPFSSLIHILFNPIIGSSTIGWHILGLLLNWGAIIFLVKTILHLWPTRIMEAGWIGLLLGVYPGMQRQFVVHTSIPHYTSMFLFSLSMYLMVRAVNGHKHRTVMLTSSIFLAVVQVSLIEYFIGLELIRPLILFYAFRRTGRTTSQAIRSALAMYIPYALVFAGFLYFKFEILPSIQLTEAVPKHHIALWDGIKQNPIETVIHYAQIALQDVLHATFFAWTLPISLQDINLQSKSYLFSWVVGGLIAFLSALCVKGWQKSTNAEKDEVTSPLFVILLCVGAMLAGGLPAWIINRQAIQGIWSDRFLFGQIFGAVPLVVLAFVWLTGRERRNVQSIALAVLLAGAISLQMRVANKYALTWNLERNYYWQLKWRAPSIKEGTFILSPYTPFDRNSHYQIAFAVNVIYAPSNGDENVPVWWYDGPGTLYNSTYQKYTLSDINQQFRSLTFTSDMTHALPVVLRDSRGCLQVLDPIYEGEPLLSEQEIQLFTAPYSELIKVDEDKPMPKDVFGIEPPHDWCYYFQKADLARSFEKWDIVISIWKETNEKNLRPRYGPEYLPFIEAYAQQEAWETVGQITLQANQTTQDMGPLLCRTWERVTQNKTDSPEKQTVNEMLQSKMTCQP